MKDSPGRTVLRSGFTLIELLVVIAIIALLLGLLLPAVQSAREAARRMQCGNNLKQIGLALLNYETNRGVFPFGCGGTQGQARYAQTGTWAAFILPQLEQQNVYDTFDFKKHMNDPANQKAVSTIVQAFICPTDPEGMTPLNKVAPRSAELFAATRLAANHTGMYGAVEIADDDARALLARVLP